MFITSGPDQAMVEQWQDMNTNSKLMFTYLLYGSSYLMDIYTLIAAGLDITAILKRSSVATFIKIKQV